MAKTQPNENKYSILGKPIPRVDAKVKVTGQARTSTVSNGVGTGRL